jgi:UDP-N-acetyl-D-glucosamine dehydrogenase
MLENVFRNINIALINELSLVFDQLGLNTWEIVQAASTKPYGFMAFYPGPGIGGHCIPVDPLYLSYRARQVGVTPRFIELGYHVNSFMPVHAVNLAELAFRQLRGKSLNRAVIGVLGLAYKRDIPDTRESPSIHIVEELRARGARVVVHDPLAPLPPELEGEVQKTKEWQQVLKESDVALFVVDHSQYKAISIATINPWLKDHYLVDCRNIFPVSHPRIVGVGRGRPFMNGKGNSGP